MIATIPHERFRLIVSGAKIIQKVANLYFFSTVEAHLEKFDPAEESKYLKEINLIKSISEV